MKTGYRVAGLAAMALAALWVAGCEDEDSPDTNGVDAYFEAHPYVSDPRSSPANQDVTITPAAVALTNAGQKVVFTVQGGKGSWTWDVAIPARGTIVPTTQTSQGVYTATTVGPNSVIVYDRYGHAAIATISGEATSSASALSAQAAPTTLSVDGGKSVLTASGGTPPYAWSVVDVALGNVDAASGSSVVYTRYSAGDNAVRVTDSAGDTVNVVIAQP